MDVAVREQAGMPLLARRMAGRWQLRIDSVLFTASFLVLLLLFAVVGGALLYRSTLHYQINYNEGWNSYFVARVLDGLALYPERSTQLINNYPPLSFYIVAAVAKLTGSVLGAGRAVAWASYLGCAGLIGLVLRRLGANWAGAGLGALFFATAIAVRCDLYVGMFDPHFTGLMLMLAGLLVLLRGGTAATVLAAALMAAGGFVKHSLIGLPITATLWLALFRPRQLLAWLLAGAAFVAAGLAACVAAYGPEFAAGLGVPRHVDIANGVRKVLKWVAPLQLPGAVAVLPVLLGGAEAALVGIYLVVALGTAVIGAAPQSTNYNMIFEVLAAISLGLGLAAGRFAPRIPSGWVALAAAASLVLAAAELGTAQTTSWRAWSAEQQRREALAVRTIAAIRSAPGPALCGTLLYCFAAGKPFAYDPLNYGTAPGEDQSGLRADIARGHFGVIQLDYDNMYFTAATRDAVARAYVPVSETLGVFVPLR